MPPEIPEELLVRAADWSHLSRWERAELGRDLRRLGLTYGEIIAIIPVAKSTLAGWCRGIRLSSEQVEAIKARRPPGVRTGVPVDTQRRRRAEIEEIRSQAASEAHQLLSTDPLWTAGVILYWAEGSKTRNDLSIANADPRALRLFLRWLRTYLDPEAEVHLQLHLHVGNDEQAAQEYWRSALALRDPRFYKTFIKPPGTGHRKNHLPHGICRIRVCRAADSWQRVMAWIDVVAGEFGRWGDGYTPSRVASSIGRAGAS